MKFDLARLLPAAVGLAQTLADLIPAPDPEVRRERARAAMRRARRKAIDGLLADLAKVRRVQRRLEGRRRPPARRLERLADDEDRILAVLADEGIPDPRAVVRP